MTMMEMTVEGVSSVPAHILCASNRFLGDKFLHSSSHCQLLNFGSRAQPFLFLCASCPGEMAVCKQPLHVSPGLINPPAPVNDPH